MNTVLFDPGYSSCVLGISDNVEFMYSTFQASFMPPKQKKFQFSILLPKLQETLKQNVAFYLGCLLWASYIKTFKNAQIEENPCLGDDYDKEVALSDVNYLKDFSQNILIKDAKYYINKSLDINPRYILILDTYIEFIKLNKGFVNLKTTDELLLPKNLKALDKENATTIKNKIDEVLCEKKLSKLFDVYELILD